MTWQPGRDQITELVAARELRQVAVPTGRWRSCSLMTLAATLASAAAASASGDLSGAYLLAYDALRKSAASLLAVQGLRATSRGGHIAIQEAAVAQFGSTVRVFRSFGIRRARNGFGLPATPRPTLPQTT